MLQALNCSSVSCTFLWSLVIMLQLIQFKTKNKNNKKTNTKWSCFSNTCWVIASSSGGTDCCTTGGRESPWAREHFLPVSGALLWGWLPWPSCKGRIFLQQWRVPHHHTILVVGLLLERELKASAREQSPLVTFGIGIRDMSKTRKYCCTEQADLV